VAVLPDLEVETPGVTWPLAHSCPTRRVGVSAVALDDNVALYDDVGQLLILLNRSAAAVWHSCDGVNTLSEVVEILARAHAESVATVQGDVWATIHKLRELGLLHESEPPTPT
jgi:hypothetical protein